MVITSLVAILFVNSFPELGCDRATLPNLVKIKKKLIVTTIKDSYEQSNL